MRIDLIMDWKRGTACSCRVGHVEMLEGEMPVFELKLRDEAGNAVRLTPYDAQNAEEVANGAVYTFADGLTVKLTAEPVGEGFEWKAKVSGTGALQAECVRYPRLKLKPLAANGGKGTILFPYNEGALVDDVNLYHAYEPEYPSLGAYGMYPNMVQSSFMCYMQEGMGLYLGEEDPGRGPKLCDFAKEGTGVTLRLGMFCGVNPGEDYAPDFPVAMKGFEGNWMDGAALYREWFEAHLPEGVTKSDEDPTLPKWYADSPLVVGYPVRGFHDMDEMKPNALFPYENALPCLREIKEKTQSPIMALLMHWEGTAPWAPPFVWPPYGGEDSLNRFADALHEEGDTLGVYCSGFGYTLQSNLIAEYNREADLYEKGWDACMCVAPDHTTMESKICTGQRKGLDICVGSEKGRELLNEAYAPLFSSKVDYAQILDQNHGGGQYFCYSRDHGHPSVPGPWMTEHMTELLSGWKKNAPGKLFGCESACGEPFMSYLRFSDNRYELNWMYGRPVPLYAYLYHPYLRNFMGNQVCCGLAAQADTLPWRLGYSFAAGDAMTLVLLPDGRLLSDWGAKDFSLLPDKERALTFVGNMRKLWNDGAAAFLLYGKMEKPEPVECGTVTYPNIVGGECEMEAVISTAWEYHGKRIQLLVNPTAEAQTATVAGTAYTIPALEGILLKQ